MHLLIALVIRNHDSMIHTPQLDTIKFDSLDCATKVLAAALIAALPSRASSFSREGIIKLNYSPSGEFTLRAMDQLCRAQIVELNDEGPKEKLSFNLQIPNNKQVLALLLKSLQKHSLHNVSNLTIDVLAVECLEYLLFELKSRGIDLSEQSPPPECLLELLQTRTCAEVHMLIWRVFQNMSSSDLRIMTAINDDSSSIESIISDACLLNAEIVDSGRILKGFQKRPKHKRSVISKILFDQYYRMGAAYFKQLRLSSISEFGGA